MNRTPNRHTCYFGSDVETQYSWREALNSKKLLKKNDGESVNEWVPTHEDNCEMPVSPAVRLPSFLNKSSRKEPVDLDKSGESIADREMSFDPTSHRSSIPNEPSHDIPLVVKKYRDSIGNRLECLGIPLKWKASIRIAPLKDSGLEPNVLESKVSLIEKWVGNLRQLKPDLLLPDVESVAATWEMPRDGNRFKIIRICFKDKRGLGIMKDLMYGSKLNLVEGFPKELEMLRNKIYVSQSHPRRGRGRLSC